MLPHRSVPETSDAHALQVFQHQLHTRLLIFICWQCLYAQAERYQSFRASHRASSQRDRPPQRDAILLEDLLHGLKPQAEELDIKGWLEEELRSAYFNYFEVQSAPQAQLSPGAQSQFRDAFENSLSQLGQIHLSWLLKHYALDAERHQCRHENQQRQLEMQRAAEARVAQRVERQSRFLLRRRRYTRNNAQELQERLQTLAQVISPEEFEIYLHSAIFRQRLSPWLEGWLEGWLQKRLAL